MTNHALLPDASEKVLHKACAAAADIRGAILEAHAVFQRTAKQLRRECSKAGIAHTAEFYEASAQDCRHALCLLPRDCSDIEASARLKAAGLCWLAEAALAGKGNYHRWLLW